MIPVTKGKLMYRFEFWPGDYSPPVIFNKLCDSEVEACEWALNYANTHEWVHHYNFNLRGDYKVC